MTEKANPFNSRPVLAAACAAGTIGVLIFSVLPFLLGLLADALSINDQEIGLLASSYVGGYTLVTILSFVWITRLNWRTAFRLGVALLVSGFAVSYVWDGYRGVALGLAVSGAGAGFAHALSAAMVAEMNDADRKYGIKMIPEQGIAAVLLFLMPVTVIAYWGLAGAQLTLAAVFLLALLFATSVPSHGVKQHAQSVAVEQHGSTALVFLALLGLLAFFGGIAGVWAFLERLAVDAGIDRSTAQQMLAIGVISSALGPIIPAIVGDRFGRALPLFFCGLAMLGSVYMLSMSISAWSFALILIVLPLSWYAGMAYQMGVIADADYSGRFSVLMTAALGIGATIGPGLLGLVKTRHGDDGALLLAALIALVGLVATAIVAKKLAR